MKYSFTNQNGETLAANLEMPSGHPKCFAIFAHCFTCSKNILAARTISQKLNQSGIAVLRFDFTGLGNSEGDFSNTNFSSNVEDLIAANQALTTDFEAPKILIGHSLGGAAVLKAAQELSNIQAITTIGAPSSVGHVSHLFQDDLEEINQKGEAQVLLAGRPFKIKKQFIEDLSSSNILTGLKNLKKALLIMHSPIDDTVSIDHAAELFLAAKHPKSFVSLDKADHLLSQRSNSEYVADLIGTWANNYISPEPAEIPKLKPHQVLIRSRHGLKFSQDIFTQDHHLIGDEPSKYKGDNLGPNPYDFLLSALGCCTAMTIKMYAARKDLKIDSLEVLLSHEKVDREQVLDSESSNQDTKAPLVDKITKRIKLSGDFSDEQKTRIFEIAERCPVNLTLKSQVWIESEYE